MLQVGPPAHSLINTIEGYIKRERSVRILRFFLFLFFLTKDFWLKIFFSRFVGGVVIGQPSSIDTSKICLQWNSRYDVYDLIADTHIQYYHVANSREGVVTNLNLKRIALGKKQDSVCISDLGKPISW